jgi:hypothetical protein
MYYSFFLILFYYFRFINYLFRFYYRIEFDYTHTMQKRQVILTYE